MRQDSRTVCADPQIDIVGMGWWDGWAERHHQHHPASKRIPYCFVKRKYTPVSCRWMMVTATAIGQSISTTRVPTSASSSTTPVVAEIKINSTQRSSVRSSVLTRPNCRRVQKTTITVVRVLVLGPRVIEMQSIPSTKAFCLQDKSISQIIKGGACTSCLTGCLVKLSVSLLWTSSGAVQ